MTRSSETSLRLVRKFVPRAMRAVVDTNIFLSALIRAAGVAAAVLKAFRDRRFELVISVPLFDEVRDVLSRPKLVAKYRLLPADTQELLQLLGERAVVIRVSGDTY